MTADPTKTTVTSKHLDRHDFASHYRRIDEGRRVYLAGLAKDECPYPRNTDKWDWWREGYDQ